MSQEPARRIVFVENSDPLQAEDADEGALVERRRHRARADLQGLLDLRGSHLSNTTCLTHVFFKSGEQCSKFD